MTTVNKVCAIAIVGLAAAGLITFACMLPAIGWLFGITLTLGIAGIVLTVITGAVLFTDD